MTSSLMAALGRHTLLCDGGTGSRVQGMTLDLERDYMGRENCTEVLCLTRPDLVRGIHRDYLEAGADIVQTNSFGGSPVTLGEFGLGERAEEINLAAACLAREACGSATGDRPRHVLGSVGPGTRLPSLGNIDYDTLEAAFHVQATGLVRGGVDGILIETCQDPLQVRAAVNGARLALGQAGRENLPVLLQVTVETTGTLLVGTDIAAMAVIATSLGVDSLGLNCATGPREMAGHLRRLCENWRGPVTVQPNAGLPELFEGQTRYPLSPAELALWLGRFVTEHGVSMIGGCCGTTPAHIAELDAMLRRLGDGADRPPVPGRNVHPVPALASLYEAVPMRQENTCLLVAERCNANGSKKFRELLGAGAWDSCVSVAQAQEREGAHALDLCVALVGRDEQQDMETLTSLVRGAIRIPLILDSTEERVLEAGLKLHGGKSVINSINLEDGEAPAIRRLELARKHGAAVVALAIDETGMAREAEHKIRVIRRLYDLAVNRHGLPPGDLFFDPLTFTICTGNEDDRSLAHATLDAISHIATEMPDCQILLGLSNVSFGLLPAARRVLNSVFLDMAMKRGLTAAILHASGIMPIHGIPPGELEAATDLVLDRRRPGHDPLLAFIGLFPTGSPAGQAPAGHTQPAGTPGERLVAHIVEGRQDGLADSLEDALKETPPLDIINGFLLEGMRIVGDLFGAGKMQLPFVLRSAETMKAAVSRLEPLLAQGTGVCKGTIVLATVQGDVHDIGKNLVDIILTNNGYRVVNLGIRQPVGAILGAVETHRPDAVGMSGLLVRSTVVMRENLVEMTARGLEIPVILGGAALTRAYVDGDCRTAYGCGRVAYARDAFDGLRLMEKIREGRFDDYLAEEKRKHLRNLAIREKSRQAPGERKGERRPDRPSGTGGLVRTDIRHDTPPPSPPFYGSRLVGHVDPRTLVPWLNETMLYQFHWGYRKAGRTPEEFREYATRELRPVLAGLVSTAIQEKALHPAAVYGYFRAAREGNAIRLHDAGGRPVPDGLLAFPRQDREDGLCIADFVLPAGRDGPQDVIALQVVTVGQEASETARAWLAGDRYQDYLHLHGLSVEMAEAMAEYIHARIRSELGHGDEDARDMNALLRQGYRGARYSFGYPACPDLSRQELLLSLLDAGRIGVSLTTNFELDPEQSTSAIVLHHPQARYFVMDRTRAGQET